MDEIAFAYRLAIMPLYLDQNSATSIVNTFFHFNKMDGFHIPHLPTFVTHPTFCMLFV